MPARVKKRSDTATNRESDKVIARLPEGMRAALAEAAARNGRSMNAEIVHALALHLAEEGMTTDERLKGRLRAKLGVALTELVHEAVDDEITQFRFDARGDKRRK